MKSQMPPTPTAPTASYDATLVVNTPGQPSVVLAEGVNCTQGAVHTREQGPQRPRIGGAVPGGHTDPLLFAKDLSDLLATRKPPMPPLSSAAPITSGCSHRPVSPQTLLIGDAAGPGHTASSSRFCSQSPCSQSPTG